MAGSSGKRTLRIIGGQWRGRKIHFPHNAQLRPTPDRVRETLFNWLMPVIQGARCLDLFCGSGGLGLEALSRGAAQVVFVDSHKATVNSLQNTCDMLGSTAAQIQLSDVRRFLAGTAQPFDVVFLDPPYAGDFLLPCIEQLQQGWLTAGAWVYLEHDGRLASEALPADWQLHREKQAGQVCYALYHVGG